MAKKLDNDMRNEEVEFWMPVLMDNVLMDNEELFRDAVELLLRIRNADFFHKFGFRQAVLTMVGSNEETLRWDIDSDGGINLRIDLIGIREVLARMYATRDDAGGIKMCNARININGLDFTCHMDEALHPGKHYTRVQTSHNVYDGFDWDIDDKGTVTLDIPEDVVRWFLTVMSERRRLNDSGMAVDSNDDSSPPPDDFPYDWDNRSS